MKNIRKGIVDPESFTQTYDEYISKLSTGRVLGMIDQWWDFAYTAGDAIKQAGLDAQGCDYIRLPITIDESVKTSGILFRRCVKCKTVLRSPQAVRMWKLHCSL